MADTFMQTLHSVVSGARLIEEFSGVLVGSAVEDALLCVARDFGHDYAALLKRYKDDVVSRHTPGSLVEKTTCRGLTKHNKQCLKRAQIQGYCLAHAAQRVKEEARRRKLTAYKATVHTSHVEAALEGLLGVEPCGPLGVAVPSNISAHAMSLL